MRERDFLRALIHAEYTAAKATIYVDQSFCLRAYPNSLFVTIFDYTSESLYMSAHPLESSSARVQELRAYGAEWEHSVARAKQSGGRIALDVVRLHNGRDPPYYVLIPLRKSRSDIQPLLREIAAEGKDMRQTLTEEEFCAKFQAKVDVADKGITETH
ncbi:hypothetical protein B0H19DRAFT_1253466 [Mycena capillaripes]|nr:hypothetical protein B0H19DRAFT_1253466 [Mycena capillaripes]